MDQSKYIQQLSQQQIQRKLETLSSDDNVLWGGFGIHRNAGSSLLAGRLIQLGTPYRIQENRIILVQGGSADFQANLTQYRAESGDVFLQRKGMLVQADSFSQDFRCLVISHAENACLIPPPFRCQGILLSLDGNTFRTVEEYAGIIWQLIHRTPPPVEVMAQTLISLYGLLKTLDRWEIPLGFGNRKKNIASAFIQLVSEKCTEEHSLRYYADTLCISQHYLSEAVSSVTGLSPKTWIDRALMQEIRYRLLYTEDTNKTISEEMAFPNPSFFNRFFKQRQGIPPGKYRSECK